jgi:hypothetical protein
MIEMLYTFDLKHLITGGCHCPGVHEAPSVSPELNIDAVPLNPTDTRQMLSQTCTPTDKQKRNGVLHHQIQVRSGNGVGTAIPEQTKLPPRQSVRHKLIGAAEKSHIPAPPIRL